MGMIIVTHVFVHRTLHLSFKAQAILLVNPHTGASFFHWVVVFLSTKQDINDYGTQGKGQQNHVSMVGNMISSQRFQKKNVELIFA